VKNLKARCATLLLSLLAVFNPNNANAQAYDPSDMAVAQGASLQALKEVQALRADLQKANSPAAPQVASCETRLQSTTTCTGSCDPRAAVDFCGRALARAASSDSDPRIGQVLSSIRGLKAQLADVQRTVHTIDGTTQRTEEGVDTANRGINDLKAGQSRLEDQMAQLLAKAQIRGVCGDLVDRATKLQPAAQTMLAASLKDCIARSVPDSTRLGLAAIDEGVGLVSTPDFVIVDPTQSGGTRHGVLPWILMPLSGCAVGGLTGYALAEGDTVDFGGQRHDNGDEGKGIALGCASGAAIGAVGALIYNSATKHGD
jgi:hypothetical protein